MTKKRDASFLAQLELLNKEKLLDSTMIQKAFKNHYTTCYNKRIESGGTRKTTWRNSAQTNLSTFKTTMKKYFNKEPTPEQIEWLKGLHLNKVDSRLLMREKRMNVKAGALRRKIINDPVTIVLKAIGWLSLDSQPVLQVIAIAILTGRRSSEIVLTGSFSPPKYPHAQRHDCWCQYNGTLKRGRNNIEIYTLCPWQWIVKALENVRKHFSFIKSVEEANKKMAYRLSRLMKKTAPLVQRCHDWRKFYIKMGMMHFNEIQLPEWLFGQLYLGHNSESSESITTYMNFVVNNSSTVELDYGKGDLYGKSIDEIMVITEIYQRCVASTTPQYLLEDSEEEEEEGGTTTTSKKRKRGKKTSSTKKKTNKKKQKKGEEEGKVTIFVPQTPREMLLATIAKKNKTDKKAAKAKKAAAASKKDDDNDDDVIQVPKIPKEEEEVDEKEEEGKKRGGTKRKPASSKKSSSSSSSKNDSYITPSGKKRPKLIL